MKKFALNIILSVLGATGALAQAQSTASMYQEHVEMAIERLVEKGYVIVQCKAGQCINVFDDEPWYMNMSTFQDGTHIVHPTKNSMEDPDFLRLAKLLYEQN